MILFLARVIEQLDLALDQLVLNDPNYERFALMLVDNAMELALHRHAEDKEVENTEAARFKAPPHDQKVLREALGQRFDAKVRFARTTELLAEVEAGSINTLHTYRNHVYHRGLEYEPILSALALFYFRITIDTLIKYQPRWYSMSTDDRIPYRAQKYIGNKPYSGVDKMFEQAYRRLLEVAEGIPFNLVADLHGNMRTIIEVTDASLEFLADDSPGKSSRDQVVINAQVWPFALSDEGKAYAKANEAEIKTVGDQITWLSQNYPWPVRADPIEQWKSRLSSLENEADPHKALRKYHEFMMQTEDLREKIDESARQLDMHIQQEIDRARGK